MKKSLIALAALAASGAAMAQSSVNLYGIVDVAATYVDGNNKVVGLSSGALNTSRLGFRGTEDLGNGLKATFKLEADLGADNGVPGGAGNNSGGLAFTRESTVGLEGGFGAVRFGRELVASYNAVSRYDPFGTVGVGGSKAWVQGAQTRTSNGIAYTSPSFSGFKFGANVGFGEGAKASRGRFIGLGLTYDQGPLSLGFGAERQNGNVDGVNTTTVQVGGAYDFGAAKLSAAYVQSKVKPADSKTKAFLLGVSAPVGANGVVKVSYNNYKAGGSAKADQLALGYQHNLSKRTALYTSYSYIKNKNGLGVTLSSGLTAGLKNGKQHGLQAGIRHAF